MPAEGSRRLISPGMASITQPCEAIMSGITVEAGATCPIELNLNGQLQRIEVHPWTTLLDMLR